MISKFIVDLEDWQRMPITIRQRACRLGGRISIEDQFGNTLAVVGEPKTASEKRATTSRPRLEIHLSPAARELATKHAAAQELSLSRWIEAAILAQARAEKGVG